VLRFCDAIITRTMRFKDGYILNVRISIFDVQSAQRIIIHRIHRDVGLLAFLLVHSPDTEKKKCKPAQKFKKVSAPLVSPTDGDVNRHAAARKFSTSSISALNKTKRYAVHFIVLYRGDAHTYTHTHTHTHTLWLHHDSCCRAKCVCAACERVLGMSVCVLRTRLCPAHAWRTPSLALQFSCTAALNSVHFPLWSCQCKQAPPPPSCMGHLQRTHTLTQTQACPHRHA